MNVENPSTCIKCGTTREGHSHLILYGDWDPEQDGFTRPPAMRPLCEECFRKYHDRVVGAHYDYDEPQRVWDILAASQGDLVADLFYLFVGGRPMVRVVDGSLQGVSVRPRAEQETDTLHFDTEVLEDVDREWFFDTLRREDRGLPNVVSVILRPVEETPFGDVRDRGGHSQKLSAFHRENHQ